MITPYKGQDRVFATEIVSKNFCREQQRVSNSDQMIINNNHVLSYVIRLEERLALKGRSLTNTDKERS